MTSVNDQNYKNLISKQMLRRVLNCLSNSQPRSWRFGNWASKPATQFCPHCKVSGTVGTWHVRRGELIKSGLVTKLKECIHFSSPKNAHLFTVQYGHLHDLEIQSPGTNSYECFVRHWTGSWLGPGWALAECQTRQEIKVRRGTITKPSLF